MNDSENILNRDEKSKDSKDDSPRVVFRLCRDDGSNDGGELRFKLQYGNENEHLHNTET